MVINMKSVLVGMSGGVDSSVTAALLKKQGYKVIGAVMNLWSSADMKEDILESQAVRDARAVAEKLGIEFRVLDFKELFRKKVVDYFVAEYIAGRTPNPCIVCNKHLKFGAMFDYAMSEGIDYIATGHYAKIQQDENGKHILRVSDTIKKDQSYVLYNFTQEQLSKTIMPLGEYDKEQVRKMAEEIGIDVANKPDSQEICFVEDDDYAKFIIDYANYEPEPGDILDVNGNVIGKHKGLIYYTIGQRKGIGAYGRPMFVMSMNSKDNTITLGEKGMEFSNSLTANAVNFINGEIPKKPIKVQARIRYQARPAAATVTPISDTEVRVDFENPQRAVTPGQAVVFYDGDIVIGGGFVA